MLTLQQPRQSPPEIKRQISQESLRLPKFSEESRQIYNDNYEQIKQNNLRIKEAGEKLKSQLVERFKKEKETLLFCKSTIDSQNECISLLQEQNKQLAEKIKKLSQNSGSSNLAEIVLKCVAFTGLIALTIAAMLIQAKYPIIS
jgi:hypothetical protein